jgi:hypothetical protein
MKRFRLYCQEKGRLHKIKGRQAKNFNIKACGYDTLDETQGILSRLDDIWPKSQFCIIDFKSGYIVCLNKEIYS